MAESKQKKGGEVVINLDTFAIPIAIIIAGVIIALTIFFVNKNSKNDSTSGSQDTTDQQTTTVTLDQVKGLFSGDQIKFGDENSKVLFVEFSDPSCPYCHVADGLDASLSKQLNLQLVSDGGTYLPPVPEMRKLVEDGKASYVWIYSNGHGNGQLATEALYCAYEQGKFWEVHDLLMSDSGYSMLNDVVKNDRSQSSTLADFLKSAIDSDYMKSCLESGKYTSKLSTDQTTANNFGVSGTPSFFVNAKSFVGAVDYSSMESTVKAALSE